MGPKAGKQAAAEMFPGLPAAAHPAKRPALPPSLPQVMALLQKRIISRCNQLGKPVLITRIVDTVRGAPAFIFPQVPTGSHLCPLQAAPCPVLLVCDLKPCEPAGVGQWTGAGSVRLCPSENIYSDLDPSPHLQMITTPRPTRAGEPGSHLHGEQLWRTKWQ